MEQAQDYSFNKSHAAGYALIAYRTAWLRANHPREYMAALISSVMNTKDRVPIYVNACHEMGIEVEPPDVNCSEHDFAVVEGKIRFGLNAVKNVGDSAARAIVAARVEGGAFTSIWDFTERVDPQASNKRALEALVKCGAFDSTGTPRKGMLEALDAAVSWGGRHQADRLAGQGSIFDLGGGGGGGAPATAPADPAPASTRRTSCCAWRRRRSASTSRSIRCRRFASSCAARPSAAWPRSRSAATARFSPSAGSSARSSR